MTQYLQDSLYVQTGFQPVDSMAQEAAVDTLPHTPMECVGEVPEFYQVPDLSFQGLSEYAPDTTAVAQTVAIGKEVEPVAYRPFADSGITLCVLLAFFVLAYVLTNGKRYLAQQIKNLFYMRERASLFAVETGADVRYRTLLVFLTNLLLGIFFFDFTYDRMPELFQERPPLLLLGVYVGAVLLFFLVRLLLYQGINLIFFEKSKRHQWVDSYLLIYSLLGILLFPLMLLVVFFDLANPTSYILFIILAAFGEIMLIYKCFNIFFSKRHGTLHLILYLCTLEMVPCYLLWQALITANNMLIK
jgi:hypothetical protein